MGQMRLDSDGFGVEVLGSPDDVDTFSHAKFIHVTYPYIGLPSTSLAK